MNDPNVAAVLARYQLSAAKSLGQNFLRDGNILEQIRAAACPADCILEIGAGIGSLTGLLCRGAGKVVTVEIDRKLQPMLEAEVSCSNHRFLWQDILECPLKKVQAEEFGGRQCTVVGNLPYYITTDILLMLLRQIDCWDKAVIMVQREAAERLLTPPGSKEYRAASVLVQSLCSGELLFEVPPHCFYPPPHVHSAVLLLKPRAERPEPEGYIRFVQAAFAARRKQLASSPAMQQLLKTDKEGIAALLKKQGLPGNSRGEALSPSSFYALYKLAQNVNESPLKL